MKSISMKVRLALLAVLTAIAMSACNVQDSDVHNPNMWADGQEEHCDLTCQIARLMRGE